MVRLIAAFCLVAQACGPQTRPPDPVEEDGPDAPAGTTCLVAEDCGGVRPVCVAGLCEPCRDDGDCVRYPDCRVCAPEGRCRRVERCCRGDLDCPPSFACERAPGAATGRCADEEGLR